MYVAFEQSLWTHSQSPHPLSPYIVYNSPKSRNRLKSKPSLCPQTQDDISTTGIEIQKLLTTRSQLWDYTELSKFLPFLCGRHDERQENSLLWPTNQKSHRHDRTPLFCCRTEVTAPISHGISSQRRMVAYAAFPEIAPPAAGRGFSYTISRQRHTPKRDSFSVIFPSTQRAV